MKPELYSCMKMLESLEKNCQMTIGEKFGLRVAQELVNQYSNVRRILHRNLSEEQLKFIPFVLSLDESSRHFPSEIDAIIVRGTKIQELRSACQMSVSFLRSLDGSLEKELEEMGKELKFREKEIDWKEKFVEKMLQGIKDLPELQRSKIVEGIKKSHREIEKHSKK